MSRKQLNVGIWVLIVLGVCAGVAYVVVSMDRWRAPTIALWEQVQPGHKEDAVRSRLGDPFRQYVRETVPVDYYIPGYERKEREVTGKVLIYRGADMVLYIWFDEEGHVEETFRGIS